MTPTPFRLHPIVIWFGRVGDMILLSALLNLLHQRYRARCFVVGAGAWTAEIYKGHHDVERIWYLRRYTPFLFDAGWWRAFGALRRHRSEPVYVCETDARKLKRIRLLLALSRTPRDRCVFMNEELRAAESRGERLEHWVDRLLYLGQRTPPALSHADLQAPGAVKCAPRLDVPVEDKSRTEEWLRAKGWYGRPLVLIQPGNRRTMRGKKLKRSTVDDKAWPFETWAALLHRIHAALPNAVILLVGAPREGLLLGWIKEATAALHTVETATLPLADLFALCSVAHSMISVDTGPAHAAAAVGLPLVVLFGAHSQREWLPRSSRGSPVVGIGGPPISSRLDQISDKTVFEAWLTLSGPQVTDQ